MGNPDTRRIFAYLGAAGVVALIGGGIYAAAISAVTPTIPPPIERAALESATALDERPDSSRTVTLKSETIRVQVADTPQSRARGLSGMLGLADDEGMLFVFDTDGHHSFWMKDMHFAIDILWMGQNGEIVHIVESAMPASYPADAFVPALPARYVLELSSGWVRAHRVSLGDVVSL